RVAGGIARRRIRRRCLQRDYAIRRRDRCAAAFRGGPYPRAGDGTRGSVLRARLRLIKPHRDAGPAHSRRHGVDRRVVRDARHRRLALAARPRRERSASARARGSLTSLGMETPSWGIEPVPQRLRVLSVVDSFLLWLNLGISLLVLVAAAYFGLSLKQAVLATIVGGVIGNTMLGIAAYIGADARVPTMVLQRAPLGQRGSYIATTLNVLQCLGWSVFEITVIAIAAGALSER